MKVNDSRRVYTVSEANYFAKQTLEQMELWIEGEVSSFKQNPNWRFFYLDLKDDSALLPCVADGSVFDDYQSSELLGQKILAYGFLTLYEPMGKYQFKILKIEAVGEGVLQRKLVELIKKLKGEGLFDQEHKRQLPVYPKKVCLVTSLGSDAWNDFKRHTIDKFPLIELTTVDVRVQGSKSIPQLLKTLPKVDKSGFDVIVITRGGGSLEDLAAFNDEEVARTIFKLETPTIVAIGHEANESLAEWVADRRASTPTDAANIVTSGYMQALEKLETFKNRILTRSNYYFLENFQKLDYTFRQLLLMKSYFKDLPLRLVSYSQTLKRHEKVLIADALSKTQDYKLKLSKSSKLLLESKSQRLTGAQKSLNILSFENTLKRGYSITFDESGKVLKDIGSIVVGSTIGVRLASGSLKSKVLEKIKNG